MDSTPPWRAQATVTLSNLDQRTPCAFPERKIFLTRDFPIMQIGRTSKRNSSLEALITNCWFDSAVMSREHAQLRFDAQHQKIYISDVASLHGTFLNEHALKPHEPQELREGDILRFGIPIERGRDVYNPIAMEVAISHGSIRLNDQPTIFRVPDDTDVEDASGDEESAVQHSTRLLQQHNIRPAHSPTSSNAISIDLTGNDPTSGPAITIVNLEETLTANKVSPENSTGSQNLSHIDLTSQDDDDSSHETEDIPDHAPQQQHDGVAADSKDESHPDITNTFDGFEDPDFDVDDGSDSELDSMSEAHSSTSNSAILEDFTPSEEGSSPLFVPEEEFEDDSDMDGEDFSQLGHEPLPETSHENDLIGMNKIDDSVLQPGNHAAPEVIRGPQAPLPLSTKLLAEEEPHHTIQPQCLWTSPPLPSILMDDSGKLPNLTQLYKPLPQAELGNVRLPSIFETMPNPHNLQSPVASRSTAEVLGEKTGKYEYFYARADNSMSKFKECTLIGDEVPTSHMPLTTDIQVPIQAEISGVTAQGLETPDHNPWSQEPRSMNVADTPGPWSASGNSFLSSPLPTQGCEESQSSQNVLLNDTSAYIFEKSKKDASASTPCVKAKEDLMTINNLVDPPCDRAKSPKPPSGAPKRKIDEISNLTPEESSREAQSDGKGTNVPIDPSIIGDHSVSPLRPQSTGAQGVDPNQVDFLRSGLQRPVKRLRRVAEVFGIAAIGGAFVMSALIATAPAL